ncbi:MAG: hypothetical protein ACD_57C00082G0005 [uncultured bacterium]|nr:MAG: hypothetical protein ACD_57C00082G0005 [uncultured bacterium]
MDNEDVKITIILKKGSPKLLANATISIETVYFGFVTIKGFQIWNSRVFNERLQEAINIEPPTIMSYGRPYNFVYFEKDQKWFDLETRIYDAFVKERNINMSGNLSDTEFEETNKEIE